MAKGLSPDNGVPAGNATVAGGISYATTQTPIGGSEVGYHQDNRCKPPNDRAAWNWMIANMLKLGDDVCIPYDAGSTDWLSRVIAAASLPISTSAIKYITAGVHTYTKPARLRAISVRVIGAGASGGSRNDALYGGAGGAGAMIECDFIASELPATITFTVGAGGTAVLPNTLVDGNDGGATDFYGLIAGGGIKGLSSQVGGVGGTPTVPVAYDARSVRFGGVGGQDGTDPQNTPGSINLAGFGGRGGNNTLASIAGSVGVVIVREYFTLCGP